MARIRSVKPEFWIDEKIVELSPWARLLFIGMWNFADDQGYVDHKPTRIKMQVFPGDEIDVAGLIFELLAAGRVAAYSSPVGPVLHIVNWHHQRVDKPARPRFDPKDLIPVQVPPPSPPPPVGDASRDVQEESPNSREMSKSGPAAGQEVFREDSASPRESSPADWKGSGSGSGGDLDPPLATLAAAREPSRQLALVADPGPEPRTAQQIVAWWIDGCNQRPPGRVVGQLAKAIASLIDDGFEPTVIRRGITEWAGKELHPSNLASVVAHVANRGAPIRAAPGQPTRTELTLAANQQVAQQLRAAEGGP